MSQPPAPDSVADNQPFRMPLSINHRWAFVRQSAETVIGVDGRAISPTPIEAEQLTLSSLGTSLAAHGKWDTLPYTSAGFKSYITWDHIAPLGRDQFVKVVSPGYLSCGPRWSWVQETERLIESPSQPVARLRTKFYMQAIDEVVYFDNNDLPFTEIRVVPLRTPSLRSNLTSNPPSADSKMIWPTLLSGEPFLFTLRVTDRAGKTHDVPTTLLWISAEQVDIPAPDGATIDKTYRERDAQSAPHQLRGQARCLCAAAHTRRHDVRDNAHPSAHDSVPEQGHAPAHRRRCRIAYRTGPHATSGRLHDALPRRLHHERSRGVSIWDGSAAVRRRRRSHQGRHDRRQRATDGAAGRRPGHVPRHHVPEHRPFGGFVKPDQEMALVSRAKGTLGKLAPSGGGTFDPVTFLGDALPKLFGLFSLTEVLQALGLDQMPAFITKTLSAVQGLLADIDELRATVERAVADANKVIADAQAASATAQKWATDTKTQLEALAQQLGVDVDTLTTELGKLFDPTVPKNPGTIEALFTPIRTAQTTLKTAVETIVFPPALKTPLRRLVNALDPYLKDAAAVVDAVKQVITFLDGLDPTNLELRARLDWSPPLKPWPSANNAIFSVRENEGGGLTIAVEMRASAKTEPSVDVLAELRRFDLTLFGTDSLMALRFERLAFQGGSSHKPEVDVVFGGIEFLGPLAFIETLRQLIPFDGFSDPPFLDVSAEGVRAGFTLALPNVAVGVFALSNISLGADCSVPFLGKHVTVGFNFCTRERPFSLTVTFIGGGGFVGLRAAPDGLDLLEMSLEAGARLAVDLGIASGSIEAMIGVYLRLEAKKGSLTGYFRLRGEVDVLGIISVSIELLLELIYAFDTGKLVGRATLTIEVEVFMFSFSVSVTVERQFAGSNGDPTFAELMDVQADGSSVRWSEYCEAFAGV